MNIDKNDPKLTAFVLGELSEAETLEVQAALDAEESLRQEVDEIRRTVGEIEEFLHNEPIPGEATVSTPKDVDKPTTKRRFNFSLVHLLVVVVIGGVLIALSFPAQQASRHAARRMAAEKVADMPVAMPATTVEDSISPSRYEEAEEGTKVLRERVDRAWSTLDNEQRVNNSWPEESKPVVMAEPPELASNSGQPPLAGRASIPPERLRQRELLSKKPTTSEPAPAENQSGGAQGGGMVNRGKFQMMQKNEPGTERSAVAGPASGSGGAIELEKTLKTHDTRSSDGKNLQQDFDSDSGTIIGGGKLERQSGLVAERSPIPVPEGPKMEIDIRGFGASGSATKDSGKLSERQGKSDLGPAREAPASPDRHQYFGSTTVGGTAVNENAPLLAAGRRPERGTVDDSRYDERQYFPDEDRQGQQPQRPVRQSDEEYSREYERFFDDPHRGSGGEVYKSFVENTFLRPKNAKFSTFSIDVDTAAYSTMRRYVLDQNQRPPVESVRLEEYVNYFKYDYAQPTDGKPFATHVDVSRCPWQPRHLLARIGIKGKEFSVDERPPLNLVFLIDTSGSMSSSNRLPLVKRGLTELVEMLQPKDRVAIVTYAGSSKLALPSVSGQEKRAILDSINALSASGSTAGAQGIKTAYETARKYYDKSAQNRVILCTDGDFNVGMTDNKALERLIGDEAKSGVFLTVLGFGMGNYKDDRLKTLSMRGNGNYGYIDTIEEARRMLVTDLTGTLFAIAKDVKIQVDFNPNRVAGYRLLGYENRKLRDEDFHNDKIDAGEIGAGHTVTALYEIIPAGGTVPALVDESRYADVDRVAPQHEVSELEDELMFVKLRYKEPDGDRSALLEYPVVYDGESQLSGDAEFAAAVALYGMLLRHSRYSGDGSWETVLELASPNTKGDAYRKEFLQIVEKAKNLR